MSRSSRQEKESPKTDNKRKELNQMASFGSCSLEQPELKRGKSRLSISKSFKNETVSDLFFTKPKKDARKLKKAGTTFLAVPVSKSKGREAFKNISKTLGSSEISAAWAA